LKSLSKFFSSLNKERQLQKKRRERNKEKGRGGYKKADRRENPNFKEVMKTVYVTARHFVTTVIITL